MKILNLNNGAVHATTLGAGQVPLDTANFDKNLSSAVTDIQKLADAVDELVLGNNFEEVVQIYALCTTNFGLFGALTTDGVTAVSGQIWAFSGLTDAKKNGFYTANTSGTWVRYGDVSHCDLFYAANGTNNGGLWRNASLGAIIGTDNINLVKMPALPAVTDKQTLRANGTSLQATSHWLVGDNGGRGYAGIDGTRTDSKLYIENNSTYGLSYPIWINGGDKSLHSFLSGSGRSATHNIGMLDYVIYSYLTGIGNQSMIQISRDTLCTTPGIGSFLSMAFIGNQDFNAAGDAVTLTNYDTKIFSVSNGKGEIYSYILDHHDGTDYQVLVNNGKLKRGSIPSGGGLAPGTVNSQILRWDEATSAWVPATQVYIDDSTVRTPYLNISETAAIKELRMLPNEDDSTESLIEMWDIYGLEAGPFFKLDKDVLRLGATYSSGSKPDLQITKLAGAGDRYTGVDSSGKFKIMPDPEGGSGWTPSGAANRMAYFSSTDTFEETDAITTDGTDVIMKHHLLVNGSHTTIYDGHYIGTLRVDDAINNPRIAPAPSTGLNKLYIGSDGDIISVKDQYRIFGSDFPINCATVKYFNGSDESIIGDGTTTTVFLRNHGLTVGKTAEIRGSGIIYKAKVLTADDNTFTYASNFNGSQIPVSTLYVRNLDDDWTLLTSLSVDIEPGAVYKLKYSLKYSVNAATNRNGIKFKIVFPDTSIARATYDAERYFVPRAGIITGYYGIDNSNTMHSLGFGNLGLSTSVEGDYYPEFGISWEDVYFGEQCIICDGTLRSLEASGTVHVYAQSYYAFNPVDSRILKDSYLVLQRIG